MKAGSTIFPVATEMAEWLYVNWSLRQIDGLGDNFRRIFMTAIRDLEYLVLSPPLELLKTAFEVSELGDVCALRLEHRGIRAPHGFSYAVLLAGGVVCGDARYPDINGWVAAVLADLNRPKSRPKPKRTVVDLTPPRPWIGGVEAFHSGCWVKVSNYEI